MNDKATTTPQKTKRLLSILASLCFLVCIPLVLSTTRTVEQGEVLAGYSGLGVSVSFITALSLSGIILGQIALFRGERPIALPVMALLLNASAFLFLLFNYPG